MAPSHKRKRKPLPKRACPCCFSLLSEKTIDRHLAGKHVPNKIKVTRAAAYSCNQDHGSAHNTSGRSSDFEISTDVSSEVSGEVFSEGFSDVSGDFRNSADPDPIQTGNFDSGIPFDEAETANDVGEESRAAEKVDFVKVVQETWSGRRTTIEVEESDTDGEEDPIRYEDTDSELDLDIAAEETGLRNGLGMDDLIDEDFQRIIANFGA